MSAESVSELPLHYGEVHKDGTRIEHPSEDQPGERPAQGEPSSLTRKTSQSATSNRPTLGLPDQDIPNRLSRDEARTASLSHGRPIVQHYGGSLDAGRPPYSRNEYRRSLRPRRRYDDYERYSDYEEEYEEPYRPRRIQQRAYFPGGEEHGPRRRPSRASRQGAAYSRDPRRMSLDEYDEEPYTPGRYPSEKKPVPTHTTYAEQPRDEWDIDEEERGFNPRNGSPGRHLRFQDLTREEKKEIMRLPWTQWMDSNVKNHTVACLGEFVGTLLFLWFAFAGTQVANIPSGESAGNSTSGGATGFSAIVLLYIAIVFGFSLMVNVWVFFRISGGLFNPAVSQSCHASNSVSH